MTGCKCTPRTILTVKSHIYSQIYCRHKIEIEYSRNMKICNLTKLGVLHPNPWPEILYEEILTNFQNEAVSSNGVYTFVSVNKV